MSEEDLERLRNPTETLPCVDAELVDPYEPAFLHCLRDFMSCAMASEKVYNNIQKSYLARHPREKYYSLYQVKRRLELLTGIVPVQNDMCPEAHVAYCGVFGHLDACPDPNCAQPRYDPKIFAATGIKSPRMQFTTIPIGPILQALYHSYDSAEKLQYFVTRLEQLAELPHIEVYDDTCCGSEFINLFRTGGIRLGDIVLQLSLDGAQLFRDKESDCWIYVWILHMLHPDLRYTKKFVMPGGFILGKPQNIESFIFPGLFHIAALQNEGFKYYDAYRNIVVEDSRIIVALNTADSVAMATWAGTVGHSGKHGCRLFCSLPGRRRPNDGHYYPVLLKPHNYTVAGSDHNDITFVQLRQFQKDIPTRYRDNLQFLCNAANPTQYNARRLKTGLCKPSIVMGLKYGLGVPNSFAMDIMHLADLNNPDLWLGLWRGTIKSYGNDSPQNWPFRVLVDKVWTGHGQTVPMCVRFIPTSFGRSS